MLCYLCGCVCLLPDIFTESKTVSSFLHTAQCSAQDLAINVLKFFFAAYIYYIRKPGRETSEETHRAETLILDFLPAEP